MVLKRMLCGISARESCGRSQLRSVASVRVAFDVHSISVWMTLPKLGSGTLKARAAIIIREFGIRKGLKKLVISSKIRIFIVENQ